MNRKIFDAVLKGPSLLVTALSLFVALLVGALLILVSDPEVPGKFGYFFAAPGDALSSSWHAVAAAYGAMLKGAIFDPGTAGSVTEAFRPISETITEAIPLIFGGLSIGLAFRAGLFNIGGQGQLIAGAICACYAGFTLHVP